MIIEEFSEEVEKVHRQIEQELQNRKSGFEGPGTSAELSSISKEFYKLKNLLSQEEIPLANQRWLSATRIVTDTWDFTEPLGEEICRIGYLYRHELET